MPAPGCRLNSREALRGLLRSIEVCGWFDPKDGDVHGRLDPAAVAEAYRALGEDVPQWVGNPRSSVRFIRVE